MLCNALRSHQARLPIGNGRQRSGEGFLCPFLRPGGECVESEGQMFLGALYSGLRKRGGRDGTADEAFETAMCRPLDAFITLCRGKEESTAGAFADWMRQEKEFVSQSGLCVNPLTLRLPSFIVFTVGNKGSRRIAESLRTV